MQWREGGTVEGSAVSTIFVSGEYAGIGLLGGRVMYAIFKIVRSRQKPFVQLVVPTFNRQQSPVLILCSFKSESHCGLESNQYLLDIVKPGSNGLDFLSILKVSLLKFMVEMSLAIDCCSQLSPLLVHL